MSLACIKLQFSICAVTFPLTPTLIQVLFSARTHFHTGWAETEWEDSDDSQETLCSQCINSVSLISFMAIYRAWGTRIWPICHPMPPVSEKLKSLKATSILLLVKIPTIIPSWADKPESQIMYGFSEFIWKFHTNMRIWRRNFIIYSVGVEFIQSISLSFPR